MKRQLEITIDSGSWKDQPIPPLLTEVVGKREVDVHSALLFTALCTRPPNAHGFDLSDQWAWHRYRYAIADGEGSDLRLRAEWADIDPHQKTILSDELGVGFTTQFIQSRFGCLEFVDTLYVAKVLEPQAFELHGGKKLGPRKSPDYIARLGSHSYLVLECKGTQSSRARLIKAMNQGRKQKCKLKARGPTLIKHALVAGLFIPQWQNTEQPCIRLADPSWLELEALLGRHQRASVDEAITRIALAKQAALAGLIALPAYLISSSIDTLGKPPDEAIREIDIIIKKEFFHVFDSANLDFSSNAGKLRPRVTLTARPPANLFSRLREHSLKSNLLDLLRENGTMKWHVHHGQSFSEVTTPIGFTFRLEVEAMVPIRTLTSAQPES